jgi:hypothetical protein
LTTHSWLKTALVEASTLANSLDIGWSASFNPPSTEADLRSCEHSLKEVLSPSHRAFLSEHNGARFALTIPRPSDERAATDVWRTRHERLTAKRRS